MTAPTPYPPLLDPAVGTEQEARWSFWPVSYQFGDLTVISNAPLPLSGPKFSWVMRGVGELRASLQLADEEVRAIYPWDKVIPRKTGIVAVREVYDAQAARWVSSVFQHYTVWAAPRNPHSGRMEIVAYTVEGLWARRLITRAISWVGVDQATIAADLLNPALWSLIPLGGVMWPGWITVDPPGNLTGVARTFSYDEGQETNLLEAHQNRSQLSTNSYEWTTTPRLLSGTDAASAEAFRLQYVLGFPFLGRQLGEDYPVPRLRFDRNGGGNVVSFGLQYDGSNVPNIVWGRGNGYEANQVKTQVQNTDVFGNDEWDYGFLQTEARFSDPDVKSVNTLQDYCFRYMWERLSSEQFVTSLTIRADQAPFFGSYTLGDQAVLETNDLTWPPDWYNSDGYVELIARIFGMVVTPAQGDQAEKVELLISGEHAS